MRHLKEKRKLSRTSEHRKALGRNLVASLLRQFGEENREYIVTTVAKAKKYRVLAEKLITIAKRASTPEVKAEQKLAARRRLHRLLGPAAFFKKKEDTGLRRFDLVRKLFEEIAPRYADRKGGYTRIIKTGAHRLGDGSQKVLFAFVAGPKAAAAAGAPEAAEAGKAKKPEVKKSQG
jgi:large subunit ribosomal protein L17